MKDDRKILKRTAEELKVSIDGVPRTVRKLIEETRELEEKIKEMS